jgi:hypothetical protein
MSRDIVCIHRSPVVVNPVERSGRQARCLRCGMLGQIGANSVEALDLLQRGQDMNPTGSAQARGYYETYRDPGNWQER